MFRRKKIIKTIGLIVLGLGVLGGVIAITSHFIKKDDVSIHPTFKVGGLNANGKYVEDKTTLYTEDKFACEGLKVTLDFDATIDYQIFYYDVVDNYISSTDIMSEGFSGELPLKCAYARIMILPNNDDDGKISWTEKIKYANQIDIKVSKNANKIEDRFVYIKDRYYRIANNVEDSIFVNGMKITEELVISPNPQFCSTTETLCYTGVNKTLKVDFSKIEKEESALIFVVFEFNERPTADTKFTHTDYNVGTNDYTITLKRDTQYVLMSVYCSNESVIGSNYSKFASCLSLTK